MLATTLQPTHIIPPFLRYVSNSRPTIVQKAAQMCPKLNIIVHRLEKLQDSSSAGSGKRYQHAHALIIV